MPVLLTRVLHVSDYRVHVHFDDGSSGELDLLEDLVGEAYEGLRDPQLFASLVLDLQRNALRWPNGLDLLAEYLHRRLG